MKSTKADAVAEKKVQDRKPKYMKTLLETAKKRQQLHERRVERKVQKERDAEGDEFADKGFDKSTLKLWKEQIFKLRSKISF